MKENEVSLTSNADKNHINYMLDKLKNHYTSVDIASHHLSDHKPVLFN